MPIEAPVPFHVQWTAKLSVRQLKRTRTQPAPRTPQKQGRPTCADASLCAPQSTPSRIEAGTCMSLAAYSNSVVLELYRQGCDPPSPLQALHQVHAAQYGLLLELCSSLRNVFRTVAAEALVLRSRGEGPVLQQPGPRACQCSKVKRTRRAMARLALQVVQQGVRQPRWI